MRNLAASTAYKRAATYRSIRQQEAELFLTVNAGLRNARTSKPVVRAKALADNELLWITVMDIIRDPSNQLSTETRAAVLSVGHAARREMASGEPDLDFLATINEHVAAGLSS